MFQVKGGYYSDTELECQAFQICIGNSFGSLVKYSFLCPNGSFFDQHYFVCDFWFNVDCSRAESLYGLNDDIAAEREAAAVAANSGEDLVGLKEYDHEKKERKLNSRGLGFISRKSGKRQQLRRKQGHYRGFRSK